MTHSARSLRSRLRRTLPVLAGVLVAATTVMGAPVTSLVPATQARAAGTFADPFFREFNVFGGLTKPISVRFATDGRAFVAEKGGVVKAFDSVADTTPTTVIDIRTDVNSYWDRGLLGIALDPDFLAGRPYLYLYYVYDAPPGGIAPRWNDTCPSPPGGTTDGCVVSSKLDRIEIDPDDNSMVPGSQTPILWDWCQQYPSHSGGGMAFGPDKQLYLATGDGASFTFTDYGQRGGTLPNYLDPMTQVNPCGDPVTNTAPDGEKPVITTATAEGGSLRSQDLRTMTDPVSLDGTVIRLNPLTLHASASNPLIANADPNAKLIVAHGFRNPFRLAFRPGTSDLYLGDVGNQTWEEVERVTLPTTPRTPTTMPNYGWPCYEGATVSSWQAFGINMCTNLYAAGAAAVSPPLYAYSHVNTLSPTGPCFVPDANGKMGSSVTGLAFYTPPDPVPEGMSAYPPQFDGAMFFVDYTRNCLAAIEPDASGIPDPTKVVEVASGIGHPVDLVAGPGGDLYYVDLDGGRVVQIRYLKRPVARATVTPGQALAPATFHLDGSTSSDPNGLALTTWRWDLDNDGSYDVSGPAPTYDWHVTTAGVYTVTLQVESSAGLTDTATVTVDATNDPPVPSIDTPADSLTWAVGDEIAFSGSATDSEDAPFPDSGLDWDIVMMHCPADCHEHVVESLHGVASGSFTAPDHDYPSHLVLRLTATDSHGAATRTSIDLQPKKATLSVASSPTGVPVTIGDNAVTSPSTTTVIQGGTVSVSAPLIATIGGVRSRFAGWDDAPGRVRDVTVPGPVSLVANYVPDAPDTCSTAVSSPANGLWVADRASGSGDVDWYRFALSSKRRVVVTLGNLPVDARLDLYSGCSTLVASANAAGTRFEEITKVLAAGTYRVKVSFPSDAASASRYSVRFRPMASGLVVKTVRMTTGTTAGGPVRIVGEVLNNTGATKGLVTVKATFLSASGSTVGTLTGTTFARRLGDGEVTPFGMAGTVPAWASVKYTLTAGTAAAARSLSVSTVKATTNGDGTVTETGTVKNTGSTTRSSVGIARTWYGKLGEVLDRGTATVSPSTLGAGKSGSFTITRPVLSNVQYARTQLRAS